ncbi:MAG: hypothetical protein JWP12_3182 [Bacteroidetes bacterium]|nr:hypothetical protein [Bacteroidota bacterium]
MKKIIIIAIVLFFVQHSFGQFRRERMPKTGKWKVDKEIFVSGDTLIFTFQNKRRIPLYCYTDADYYNVYKLVDEKEILTEDTTFRGIKEPVRLRYNEKIIVKKVVTDLGSYTLKYDVFIEQERNKFRVAMQQRFTVEIKN